MFLYIIVGLFLIVGLRFVYYWRQVLFLKNLNKTYGGFFSGYSKLESEKRFHILPGDNSTMKKLTELRRRKSRFVGLVKEAGFYSKGLLEHKSIGVHSYRVDVKVAENIDETDPTYIPYVMELFDNVIGYFEDRAKESFSLFYWLGFIKSLPKSTIKFVIDIVKYAFTGK